MIYKYEIPADVIGRGNALFTLPLVRDAKVLAVQVQRGTPVIWADCTPEHGRTEEVIPRNFQLLGTGQGDVHSEGARYVGTFQLAAGDYIGHVFELAT